MYDDEDNDPLDNWIIHVRDAEQVIAILDIDVDLVPKYNIGSQRYRRVSTTYDQLAFARAAALDSNRQAWESVRVNGRDAAFLKQRLWQIKKHLLRLGEGTEGYPG